MSVTHTFVSAKPPAAAPTQVGSSEWNAAHTVSIVNADVAAGAAIVESKLSLNFATHAALTLGTANGLSLVGQALSLALASGSTTGALSSTDWTTFNNKQAALTLPLSSANGGTGINNAGTITNASNTTITGGGTLALGGFTLTVPATGTADLLGTAQTITATKTISLATTTNTGLVIKTTDDNVTKPLLEFQNSSGTATTQIWPTGTVGFGTGSVAGNVVNRGVMWAWGTVYTYGNLRSLTEFFDTAALAAEIGADFSFGSRYNTGAGQYTNFAALGSRKENATANNFDGSLVMITRSQYSGGDFIEHARLNNTGMLTVKTDTTTNSAVMESLKLQGTVYGSGGGAAGLGVGLSFYAESATNASYKQIGYITSSFIVATAASFTGRLQFYAQDSAGQREGLRIDSDGTQALIGFYGVAAVARPSAYTQTYSTASKTHPTATAANLATTAATQVTPWGFATQGQAEDIATQVNKMQTDYINLQKVVNSLIDDLQALGLAQ